MSGFGDTSGVTSEKGYNYQKLVAVYYLIANGVSEIEYEVDGEDISIINEGPDRNSIEYIQVKQLSTGSFSLGKFRADVFPQLWNAYITALEKHSDKAILSTLVTNVSWDNSLRRFYQNCNSLHEQGISFTQFEGSLKFCERDYKKMKNGREREELNRFFWGFNIQHSFTLEQIQSKIVESMNKSNVREPRTELAKIMQFFSEKQQGRITRRQIEQLIGKDLKPIVNNEENTSYSKPEIHKSLLDLETIKTKYGVKEDYSDKDDLIRNMVSPVRKASKRFIYHIDSLKGISDFPLEEIDEACDIISSDLNRVQVTASKIAELKNDLWLHETNYKHAIVSMQQTAAKFGIELGDVENES
ncbi:hypothetical protein ASJ81_13915 [Methanosarcina spelaei]|uniref:CD-NTase associated protein 4-like DNA endonuclease domain-containing protein n=1 Tax=Methanosarcina spelaei TaxID=1036679 RepID=A0A2A2HYI3_9EURY|nr:dsDNA nuclease domain-containing protein [Methanosarcina spelaei]PAV14418.1 hypothetical protein ASJ81_13915 [Methanosarcina spelaei]